MPKIRKDRVRQSLSEVWADFSHAERIREALHRLQTSQKRDYTKKSKKSKKSMIVEINELARESGMSYGKFVAQMSMERLERK